MQSSTNQTPADRRKHEKLAELLIKAKDHVMSPAEIDAQRKSWVCGEMLLQYPTMTYDDAAARYDAIVGAPTPVGHVAGDEPDADVIERVAKALALEMYPDTRWPRDERDANSGVDDRQGRAPITWHFAIICRRQARTAIAALKPEGSE